jgi:DNA (cytosine-5)-methyltransferase 1
LESADYRHLGLVEIDKHACTTLTHNRKRWNVIGPGEKGDLRKFDASAFRGVDLLAAGLPCPPFSVAGRQLGKDDERNLFPAALRIIEEAQPRAVMIENVRGILDAVFEDYRNFLESQLRKLGYEPDWRLVNACDFGVSQLRPRVVFVAIKKDYFDRFSWPKRRLRAASVGEKLYPLMVSRGWVGAAAWRKRANEIAPTIVGGSHKHGGADLGPTRAKRAWATLGVDAHGIADEPPARHFVGMPRLTIPMVALLQGFPPEWEFMGGKTAAYRQIGNAFPPPVAAAISRAIKPCLISRRVALAAAV